MPKKQYLVKLSEAERAQLRTLVGSGRAAARTLAHARILLKANQGEGGPGWTDGAIAEALAVGRATVARVRRTYVAAGLAVALTPKAPDREYARKLDGAQEARLIALACGDPPAGAKRWSLRLLAARLVALDCVDTVAHETVRQVLKQTNCAPI